MNYLILLQLLLLISCSFKSKSDGDDKKAFSQAFTAEELKNMDSDGDFVSDFDEIEKGLDPYIADMPEISVNFLQDYNIKITYENEETFEVNTVTGRDNPDFKYRVGDLFQKENSLNNAARIGRFSGVSWGNISQKDYSWVKYPEVDKEFYHAKVIEFATHSDKEIIDYEINLENTLKLKNTGLFSQIEKLEVNFYYYSHEKEDHVLVYTQVIDKVFLSGVRENFTVSISNPPVELLNDSYLRRGEFLISEVKDFYIPELKTSYSKLKSSVLNKSIPVYVTTPFENSLKYVGVGDKGATFSEILTQMFGEKYKIENEKLTQIDQFADNLSNFKYLSEVAELDKEGKWFVMTNKIKRHYLKHSFTKSDSITLSYVTGSELARRVDETVFSRTLDLSSGEESKSLNLGNITSNSEIELSVFPRHLTGVKLNSLKQHFYFKPRCGRGNCSGANWWVSADYEVNTFSNFTEPYGYADREDFIDNTRVLINNTELDLGDLIENNHAVVEIVNGDIQYAKIKIKNLDKLGVIIAGSENLVTFKINSLNQGRTGEGIKITKLDGKKINKVVHASRVATEMSFKHNTKISPETWKISEWERHIKWGTSGNTPWGRRTLTKGKMINHFESQVVDVVATVTNYIN